MLTCELLFNFNKLQRVGGNLPVFDGRRVNISTACFFGTTEGFNRVMSESCVVM